MKLLKMVFVFFSHSLLACNTKQQTGNTKNNKTAMETVNKQIEANKNLIRLWVLEGWKQ